MKRNTLTEISGIIGPVLFVGVFTLAGFFQKDYSALKMHISALSLGPQGWIQRTNFMLFGLLLFVFSRNILKECTSKQTSKALPVILQITSVCFFFPARLLWILWVLREII